LATVGTARAGKGEAWGLGGRSFLRELSAASASTTGIKRALADSGWRGGGQKKRAPGIVRPPTAEADQPERGGQKEKKKEM